jgi:hypothetical protein
VCPLDDGGLPASDFVSARFDIRTACYHAAETQEAGALTPLQHLQKWAQNGSVTTAQFDAIAPVVRKERFSVFVELNALLYLGVISFVAGLGWTIQTYFANLGDAAILTGLTALLAGSLYYTVSRAFAFSARQVESPTMAFDYVLYLACLVFAAEIAYIESRFNLLQEKRDYYLLFSAVLYFVSAYRFDNRFVLSLALSTLAGWFGVKVSAFHAMSNESLRIAAVAYGILVASVGLLISTRNVKKHFLDTYLHVAANVLFVAFVSGVMEQWFYFVSLIVLAILSIYAGMHFRRFAFVVYGIVYGYIGVSHQLLRHVYETTTQLLYAIVSGTALIAVLVMLAHRLRTEE